MDNTQSLSGPDLKSGVDFNTLIENQPLLGHYEGEAAILVRQGDQVFATGATCTHYSGPLAEGLVVGHTVRCPWHHARFDMRTGEAEGAPAMHPVACFAVKREGSKVSITAKKDADFRQPCPLNPSSVVIVGSGAAGAACADMLRTKGYTGPITLSSNEDPSPVDRPNLSKDYLAGNAPEEWIPLRSPDDYRSAKIDYAAGDPAVRIAPSDRKATLRSGKTLGYGALLIATGGEARSLPIPGADLPHVFRLRTLADSKAIIAAAQKAKTCAIIGSGFIGLEVAASLRARGLEVTVISMDSVPLERVIGAELGRFVQKLHEEHGVKFLLKTKPRAIVADGVELEGGNSVKAAMVVMGVGIAPRTELAAEAGLKVDNGIVVDEALRAAPDIFAAGDVARYPEIVSGAPARIEHWVLAQRQGQAAARVMLGLAKAFRETPFFWSQHYDVTISYVGHAEKWDRCEIHGDLEKRDACAVYRSNGKVIAVASVGRDRLSLEVEAAMEAGDQARVESILRA